MNGAVEHVGGGPADRTRLVVIDDHVMVAELLARRLDEYDDLEVVGVAANLAEAVHVVVTTRPDVAVVDYHLPRADGIAVITQLQLAVPQTRTILLDSYEDDQVLREAIAAGCAGYLTKADPVDALVLAIRTVRSGGLGFDARALESLAAPPTRGDRPYGLTERELTVVRLLASGASTHELADRLFISVTTARNHVQRVISKLGAHSRLEAVAIAARSGLIPLGGDVELPPGERPVAAIRSA